MDNNFFKSLESLFMRERYYYYIFLSNSYLHVKHNFFFRWINFENIDTFVKEISLSPIGRIFQSVKIKRNSLEFDSMEEERNPESRCIIVRSNIRVIVYLRFAKY